MRKRWWITGAGASLGFGLRYPAVLGHAVEPHGGDALGQGLAGRFSRIGALSSGLGLAASARSLP